MTPSTLLERVPARRSTTPRLSTPRRSTTPRPSTPRASGSSTLVLGVILTCYLMIILDVSVVITALPDIRRAFGFSPTGLSWVQNAYTLSFGGLLLLGARAGDILGRRRTLVAGIALFTTASLLGGLAQSAAWLLAARAVQGVGAAIAAPSTLALLTVSFREGQERTRAIAAYGAVAGGGGSVGLVLGGMLTDWISWRCGLFINVPIGLALIWLAPRVLPETPRRAGRFDLAGAATSTLGMTALVYGFVRAASDGWGERGTVASFLAGAALLTAFVLIELRAEQPITPLHLFASRTRSGAYAARILVVSGLFAMFFFLTQFLQGVLGFNPLQAGLAFLPMTVVMFATVRVVPRLIVRFGDVRMLTGGLLIALAGMAWLSRLGDGTAYFPQIAMPLVLLGAGMGVALTPLTAAGIAGVAPEDAGAASGLVNVAHQLGGSLGLGALVAVFAAAGHAAARHRPAGASAAEQARHVMAHAVATSLAGSVVLLALAVLVVVVVMRRPPAAAAAAAETAPAR
jgi:EmrB/QacA subfamily drug resistance transporter